MLAMTSGRGNSVAEAPQLPATAARSTEGTPARPAPSITCRTTIYAPNTVTPGRLCGTPSTELKKLGVQARLAAPGDPARPGKPRRARRMVGVVPGASTGGSSGSTILPGTICEHFTSYGGQMGEQGEPDAPDRVSPLRRGRRQRHDRRPYGILGRSFASPGSRSIMLRVHAGRSLLSVDHGALPVAHRRRSVVSTLGQHPRGESGQSGPGATLRGPSRFVPRPNSPTKARSRPAAILRGGSTQFELFVDGARAAWARPNEPLVFDTRRVADGFHELRIVAIAAGAIETQGRVFVPVQVDNHGRAIELAVSTGTKEATVATPHAAEHEPSHKPEPPNRSVHWGQALVLAAKTADVDEIIFFCNGRGLGRAEGTEARLVVDPRRLGSGPVQIQALGRTAGQAAMNVVSRPIQLMIEANPPLPAWQTPRGVGWCGECSCGWPMDRRCRFTNLQSHLARRGRREARRVVAVGERVRRGRHRHVSIPARPRRRPETPRHGHVLYDGTKGDERERFLPVALAKGLHRLNLAGVAGANVRLRIAFGGEGTLSIGGPPFRHISP